MSNVQLAGLGNALVDALARLDDPGTVVEDGFDRGTMHLVDHDRWDSMYRKLPPDDVVIRSGGSCANAVETFAQLGGSAAFCGQVGEDPMGALYKEALVRSLGGHNLVFVDGSDTGKCLSLVSTSDAERTMFTDLGCAAGLTPDKLFTETIARADFFHFTGYLYTGGPIKDAARKGLETARASGTRISFDLADPFVVDTCRDAVLEVARDWADIVFLNAEEARRLAASDDPMDAFRLLDKPDNTVVVKLGKRGSVIRSGREVYPVESFAVDAVDTTGAGDAYAGAYLYGLSLGWDPQRCGRLASRTAAAVVAQLGAVIEDRSVLDEIRRRA